MSLRASDEAHNDALQAYTQATSALAPTELQKPMTISSSLGLNPNMPHKPFVAFQPQYPTPRAVGNVVDDMFDGYDADPVPLGAFFKKKKGGDGKKGGGIMGGLKAAKNKADAAVRKAASGTKAAIKGATAFISGLSHFDYKLYTEPISAILAVAKKANGTDLSEKNNYKAFTGDSSYKAVAKLGELQEGKMKRTMSQKKNVKGRESKTISQQIMGRNAACLGFAKVEASQTSDEIFGDTIFDPEAPAVVGAPTLVKLGKFDTNDRSGMMPITGLVVEAVDVDSLPGADSGKIAVEMEAVEAVKIGASKITLSKDEVEFDYSLCVHGLYVDGDNKLHTGPKILVPNKAMDDVSSYGIVTEKGVGRALAHAIENEKIDLLLLWASFKLVLGAKGLTKARLTPEQQEAAKELFGGLDDMQMKNSFKEMYGDECYGAMNAVTM